MADFGFKGPKKKEDVKKTPPASIGFKGPKPKAAPVEAAPSSFGPLEWATDAMRGFNDSLTFGLYDDFLEMTGVDKEATEKLTNADPLAKTIGEIGGYVVPGMGASSLAAKIPGLAANTIPRIVAREAVAGGAVSATDDLIREGKLDPTGIAMDAGMSGGLSGILAGMSRAISPSARVRAKGFELDEADKLRMEVAGAEATNAGIPLTVPELAETMVPGKAGSVTGMLESVVRSPNGSRVMRNFNEARRPRIEAAGQGVIDDLLNGGQFPTDQAVRDGAKEAIDAVDSGYFASADNIMKGIEGTKIPPTWVPKGGATSQAKKYISESPVFKKNLARSAGGATNGVVPENSILYLDATKKRMSDTMGGRNPNEEALVGMEIDDLLAQMDRVAPDYATVRAVQDEGFEEVGRLKAGPLGTLSKGNKTNTGSIFNPADAAGRDMSTEALDLLPPELPEGLLARHIDSNLNRKGDNWARTAFPSDYAEEVAGAVSETAVPTIKAAKSANLESPNPYLHENGGPTGAIFQWVRDLGAGRVAAILNDPKNIKLLNKMGPVQGILQEFVKAANAEASTRRDDGPLTIRVGGGRNSTL